MSAHVTVERMKDQYDFTVTQHGERHKAAQTGNCLCFFFLTRTLSAVTIRRFSGFMDVGVSAKMSQEMFLRLMVSCFERMLMTAALLPN